MVHCNLCGRASGRDDDQVPLGWVTSIERGRLVAYCDGCSRENVRAIESKLDAEWW
jgi:hypothetical protein